jgi:hypothetical protein
MAITKRMGEIYEAYQSGVPADVLAVRYHISKNTVLKKVAKVEQALNPKNSQKPADEPQATPVTSTATRWTAEAIKDGIDKFVAANGRMPTARDFDEFTDLPSARQVQRAFGGLVKLRERLGYEEIDFTKGELRKAIAISANKRGITAEDYFEPVLIEKFGEPYVHVQKRYYKGSKNRYDFLVYAKDRVFGIDIFTTDRAIYIEKNIRHKISRYKNAPAALDIYFVLVGEEFNAADVDKARQSVRELARYPNMHAIHEAEFLLLIESFGALDMPPGFVGLEDLEF